MNITFGEKIRNLREDAEMSQKELGAAINTTQRKISYIECGNYEPSLSDIIALCKFFNVSADYLLGLTDNT
ncbi:MAG: helix-turn-helix transcriptional regulator [Clostridia bacterium]|nr:helix-turn-helix transcriptional regulator [Clostridia bacterium]